MKQKGFLAVFFRIGTLVAALVFLSLSLRGEEPSYALFFRPNPTPLAYLTTYYALTTDVLNISQESGEDQILKNTTYDAVEAQKDLTRTTPGGEGGESGDGANGSPEATTLEAKIRLSFMKKVDKGRPAKSIQPQQKSIRHSALGRLIDPFAMEDLVAFGFPLVLPSMPVGVGASWDKKFDFKGEALPVLTMHQDYKISRIFDLNTRRVAEIEYTFRGGLQTTQITNDPEVIVKIGELKENNIESVSFEGNGRLAFDIQRGTIVTHELAMNRRLRKTTIRGEERIMQDMLTLYELTEALTN